MSMSSSAVARQRAPEALSIETLPFPYAEAEGPGEAGDGASVEERIGRQRQEAFERGRMEGQAQVRSETETALQAERNRIGQTVAAFAAERQDYYRRIESEIVELALAIARKILHRELQLDPRALCGVVRITLEKMDAGTQVSLHVHPKEAPDWRHYFACQTEIMPAPEVHEDAAARPGQCRIETSLGSTEAGFESQLKEIETGLLDLLVERPATK